VRSFITGIDGFIGSWLAEILVAAGDDVSGFSRKREGRDGGLTRLRGDLTASVSIREALSRAKPDRIFHLAGLNHIKRSFEDPDITIRTNVGGSVHLFEAMRALAPSACLISVGSSAEYGHTAAVAPTLREDMPLLPTSPYGISKMTQGHFSRVYAEIYGLRSIHVRPFAIIGPRKTGDAVSDFCQNVVAIERGETNRFAVGALSSERDFLDIRDCVSALLLISEKGKAGSVYNICNEKGTRLETLLPMLQALSRRPFKPESDPARQRAADDPRIVGDNTLLATLDYWREKS
jgi:GDP-4-dehydro-6-deoxy-D-mannose reductase